MHLAQAFYQTHPGQFQRYEGFATETGDANAWELLTAKQMTPKMVAGRWGNDLERFGKVRERYLPIQVKLADKGISRGTSIKTSWLKIQRIEALSEINNKLFQECNSKRMS